ncbi:hypothetical protein N0B44_08260 [Roseibacterium beibuensis]|uniref:ankyrin repeat domain-containing protein n=1 Tax=[Roseibacterium] beibuensis TaxID=1193142 RepID=UPI00217D1645|nr:ankyrin repeat domain-containing protein [Roseibacterium beibuensis]MCS6622899.1 hypothetical protein [Roseibacterium beibuensis]
MRWSLGLPLMILLASASQACGARQAAPSPEAATAQEAAGFDALLARVKAGADPEKDAAEAAEQGRFGLILSGQHGQGPSGVTCFTPDHTSGATAGLFRHGDFITEELAAVLAYAAAYNVAIVSRPDYRDAELCRVRRPGDDDAYFYDPALRLSVAARELTTPVRSVHEAARRGDAGDVRKWLRSTPVDAVDPFGMTALSWAVVRRNEAAVDILLAAGADPAAAEDPWKRPALYWAAATGQGPLFHRLLARLPVGAAPRSPAWPERWVEAAANGGDLSILEQMLSEPHVLFRGDGGVTSFPSEAVMHRILRDAPQDFKDQFLARLASSYGSSVRLDLLELALRAGADPDRVIGYETPLTSLTNGIRENAVEAVDILLKGGADPNFMPHRERPIWNAIGMLKLDERSDEFDARALAIVDRLIAAGADINLPDDEGLPAAWALFFPFQGRHDELDASFVTRDLILLLGRRGLDYNTSWEGRRLLAAVEEKAGRGSDYALWLREAGAR